MAQSRLEKIGTIFTRVQGLLRGGAMKPEDKPIWYDVYAAFPPKVEPRFDRPAINKPIRNVFYAEDVVRAKYHKLNRPNETINLFDTKRATQTQQFIKIYDELKTQGALDDQRIYETTLELLAERRQQARENIVEEQPPIEIVEQEVQHKSTLLSDFQEAEEKQATEKSQGKAKKEPSVGINIDSLFKD